MNDKKMKKNTLALILAVLLTAALAGCGQSAQASSREASPNGAAAVPSSAQDSQTTPPEAKPEEHDAVPDINDDTNAKDVSAPEETPPEESAQPDPSASAPAPAANQDAAPESGNLSGIDLNVQFGDDGASYILHLYDNETADAIARHVGTADWRLPIYNYDGYDNWEVMQYYDIPSRYEIPSNPQSVASERAGTVYYSEPNRIVLFYGDADVTSEYTPVGYIEYSQEFVDAVENNPVLEGWGNKIVKISR